MKKAQRGKKTRRKKGLWSYLLVMVMLFLLSTGVSYLYFKPRLAFESSFVETLKSSQPKAKHPRKQEDSSRLYKPYKHDSSIWYNADYRKDAVLVMAENVIRRYIKPYDVRLLDLYMDREGVIYIDLSNEIRKNFKGDAFEEFSIIAGLYRSIKITIPDFTALKILIEGKEVESFGGHVDISKPIGEEIISALR
jgi:hypothetical protein